MFNGSYGQEEITAFLVVAERKIKAAEVKREVEREVEEAIAFAKGSAFPDLGDLDKYLFAE